MVSGNLLGDLWDWVVGVVERIGDVSVYWLALALALKTVESAFIGLTWRNILRVAYPQSGLSFKTAWAASQGGTAINAVAPAQAAGARNRTLEIAALGGLAVFAVIVAGFAIALSSKRLANRVGDRAARLVSAAGRLVHKAPVKWNGASFVQFRDELIELIRRRWPFLTAATLAGHLTVFVVLVVSLRAVGVTPTEVTIVEAFAAWTLARILGAIPITPGGVGFVELGLTGVLVAFGASNAEAVAATMIYRLLTVVPTVFLGLVAAGASVIRQKPRETAVAKPATGRAF